jgi:hypothetical protein
MANQIKVDLMDWACSMYGRDEKCIQMHVRKPEWKRPLRGVDGKITLKWMLEI